MCANPDDPIFEPMYEKTFYCMPGDTVQVRSLRGSVVTKIWYEYHVTKQEAIRIRIDKQLSD